MWMMVRVSMKKNQGIYSGLINNTMISPTSAAKAPIPPD